MTIYIPDNLDESSFPKDCVREHEQKHLDDLPKDSGCKKDEKGCCREAGMSPDSDDFGGKDKLKESECAAYLVTAKCCTRKAGLIGGNSSAGNTYDEMLSYRKCVLDAKYNAIPCGGVIEFKETSLCDAIANVCDNYGLGCSFENHSVIIALPNGVQGDEK